MKKKPENNNTLQGWADIIMKTNPPSNARPAKDDDDPHRWEIEPHPWSTDFDFLITDSDVDARTAILHIPDTPSNASVSASAAPVVDNDRSRCFSCKHEFCKECYEIGECCKCDTEIPPRTVPERLAQHEHVEVVDGVLGGVTPLVSRTRISVHHILSYLYNGNSIEYIAENYRLKPEAIKDAVAFAQDVYDDAIDSALRSPAAATAASLDHNSIPLNSYERILTIEWDKYNARRHELIKAEQSRVLSEAEVLELFELQWLAGIKRELAKGPHVAAPVEQSETNEAYYRMAQRESQLAKKILTAVEREEELRFGKGAHGVSDAVRELLRQEGVDVTN